MLRRMVADAYSSNASRFVAPAASARTNCLRHNDKNTAHKIYNHTSSCSDFLLSKAFYYYELVSYRLGLYNLTFGGFEQSWCNAFSKEAIKRDTLHVLR